MRKTVSPRQQASKSAEKKILLFWLTTVLYFYINWHRAFHLS